MSFSYDLSWDYYPAFGRKTLSTSTISQDFVLTVYPIWFKQITIQWSIPAQWGNCSFNVYKGETENGPFTLLNNEEIHVGFIKDVTTQSYSKYARDWYVVEAIFPNKTTVLRSVAISWQNQQSRWVQLRSLDIQRREWILLSKFSGVKSLFFRRKKWGERCTECWNPDTNRVMKDHCHTCFGTSFQGGYWPGIQTSVQYEQTPNDLAFQYFGKFELNQISAWTIAFPEIDDLDLILRLSDWKMYRIEKMIPTELQTVTVRQLMQINELDKSSIEYNLITNNSLYFPAGYNVDANILVGSSSETDVSKQFSS